MQGLLHRDRLSDRLLGDFDLNHDGKVTHTEFNTVIAKRFAQATHGAPGMTLDQFTSIHLVDFQQHAADMFKRIDWQGSGRVTFEEYLAPQRAHFEMMDREGTGAIECGSGGFQRSAFQGAQNDSQGAGGRGRGAGGRGFGGFGKARFCEDADLNKDGKVTRAEFDASVAARFKAAAKGAQTLTQAEYFADELDHFRDINAKMFKRLDKDRDGKLSLAEFASGEEKMFARLDRNNDGTLSEDEMRPSFRGRGGNGDQSANRGRKARGA
jgi:Ca2+-binding EF-hand superfamily protein